MNFRNFSIEVRDRVRDICGPDFNVSLKETLKNNSVKLTSLVIMSTGSNIAPAIYLEEFYTDFCDGRDIDDIINDILKLYSNNKNCGDVDISLFESFDSIRPNVTFKLVNYEKNLGLLNTAPHRRFLDLAVIYVVSLGQTSMGSATVTIYDEHMKNWETTEEELWELARANTPRLDRAEIVSLYDMVKELTGIDSEEEIPDMTDKGMFVLTNKKRINGAACMLYDDVISDFAGKIGKDLYIIPSSIHEVILLPTDEVDDAGNVVRIINEVNSTQVSGQEILSYKLYRYNRSSGRIACM